MPDGTFVTKTAFTFALLLSTSSVLAKKQSDTEAELVNETDSSETTPAKGQKPETIRPDEEASGDADQPDPFAVRREEEKPELVPLPEGSPVPRINLKGIVIVGEKDDPTHIALIEVDGHGTYVVRANDTVSLQERVRQQASNRLVLKIEAITRQDVTIEVGSLGEVLIVR